MQSDTRRLTPASPPRGKATRSEREHRAAGSPRNAYENVEAFSEADFTGDLARFDVPTSVLDDEVDRIAPVKASAVKSARLIKGAEDIYYPRAPHGITATHQNQVNVKLLAFLESERPSADSLGQAAGPHARTHRSSGAPVCRPCTAGHGWGLPRRDRPHGTRP